MNERREAEFGGGKEEERRRKETTEKEGGKRGREGWKGRKKGRTLNMKKKRDG